MTKNKDLQQGLITDSFKSDLWEIRQKLDELLSMEEVKLKQRSIVDWLEKGDKNKKFFHAKASQWHRRNTISNLKNSRGHWCGDITELESTMVDYFRGIFQSSVPQPSDLQAILAEVDLCVMNAMNTDLFQEFNVKSY